MKYIIRLTLQETPTYIKGTLSFALDIANARRFSTREEAEAFILKREKEFKRSWPYNPPTKSADRHSIEEVSE